VKTDATDRIVSYGPSGFANLAAGRVPTATMVFCDARGVLQVGAGSTARALFVTATGRARASATWVDVKLTAVPKIVGTSCP
jgi:hypothetical protein